MILFENYTKNEKMEKIYIQSQMDLFYEILLYFMTNIRNNFELNK